MTRDEIFKKINEERDRQDAKWGPNPRNLPLGEWLAVLVEEVGEIAKSLLDNDMDNLIVEIIQVCAVGISMIEDITHEDKFVYISFY